MSNSGNSGNSGYSACFEAGLRDPLPYWVVQSLKRFIVCGFFREISSCHKSERVGIPSICIINDGKKYSQGKTAKLKGSRGNITL